MTTVFNTYMLIHNRDIQICVKGEKEHNVFAPFTKCF